MKGKPLSKEVAGELKKAFSRNIIKVTTSSFLPPTNPHQ
jgi:hypothetical protein